MSEQKQNIVEEAIDTHRQVAQDAVTQNIDTALDVLSDQGGDEMPSENEEDKNEKE